MSSPDKSNIDALRARWTHLYASHLPALAAARDPSQPKWPVHLDHCFARIILDNAVGVDQPWTRAVKAPAVRNMTVEQLQDALALGERVANGEADLVELDRRSLVLRGKTEKKSVDLKGKLGGVEKRKAEGSISKYFATPQDSPQKKRVKAEPDQPNNNDTTNEPHEPERDSSPHAKEDPDMSIQIARITSAKNLTPFRKQTLTLLCKIPRGRYSTYQAMSDHISTTSHKTCARAVGNAMRNNPFAPEVPCHRILSSDGTIGGFKGFWGEEGKYANLKRDLLAEEGVRFDSSGKVKGPPYRFGT
ncbi:hypothetical protein Q7P37_010100 [Cladosporium fusiforme]